jgi:hypothetical protein
VGSEWGSGFSGIGLSGPATEQQVSQKKFLANLPRNGAGCECVHVQSASISSPVKLPEPTKPPSQDRQSDGPRFTGPGAGGAVCSEPSLRAVSETRGIWYPRRVLKSESRRRRLAGDSDATPAVDVAAVLVVTAEMTEGARVLREEGVGEAARAAGEAGMFAASRVISVRMSPVESIDGDLPGDH